MDEKNKMELLELQSEEINRCFRCGLCRSVCPSFKVSGLEYSSPRGRIQYAKAAVDERIETDKIYREKILDCLNCMRCVDICPSGVRTDRVVLAARAELVKNGKLNFVKKVIFKTIIKSPFFMRLCAFAGYVGQKWFYEPSEFLKILVPKLMGMGDKTFPTFAQKPAVSILPSVSPALYGERKMRVGYFIGCATNLMFPGIAEATVQVLTRNGVEVVIPKNQVCCGIPVYSSGDYNNARALAEKNLAVFQNCDIDCIVTDCSSCSSALKHDVHELLGVKGFDVPVYDLTEFLARVLEIDTGLGELPVDITYHDPCHLKTGQGISEEPRELLKMVPGINLIEMEDTDLCCGGAGSFSFTHHELSRKVGASKIEQIKKTGAKYVSTPCPSCKMQIDEMLNHEGLDIKTVHPVEILESSYKIMDKSDSVFYFNEE
ncbi:(Fe-S)-binding protein [Candidatus Latescibacterota bacterium]